MGWAVSSRSDARGVAPERTIGASSSPISAGDDPPASPSMLWLGILSTAEPGADMERSVGAEDESLRSGSGDVTCGMGASPVRVRSYISNSERKSKFGATMVRFV